MTDVDRMAPAGRGGKPSVSVAGNIFCHDCFALSSCRAVIVACKSTACLDPSHHSLKISVSILFGF